MSSLVAQRLGIVQQTHLAVRIRNCILLLSVMVVLYYSQYISLIVPRNGAEIRALRHGVRRHLVSAMTVFAALPLARTSLPHRCCN